MICISPKKLVEFFDHKSKDNSRDSNCISAIAGEELALGLACHYFHHGCNEQAAVVSRRCKGRRLRGNWLDGWICRKTKPRETLYQVEVKSWSAHSKGGHHLGWDAAQKEIADYKRMKWNAEWDGNTFRKAEVRKVLTPMPKPDGHENCDHTPLVCYWFAVHPDGGTEPFFEQKIVGSTFQLLAVFSASAYLRTLNQDLVELDMPDTERRLRVLKELFSSK